MLQAENPRTVRRKHRRRWASRARIWHRRIGLVVAMPVAVVAVTGVLLNHAERLDLDRINIEAAALIHWYGLHPVERPTHYRAGDLWVSWIDGTIYANGKSVAEAGGTPRGAVELDSLLAVATSDTIVIFTREGEPVERLGAAFLPGVILRVGTVSSERMVIGTAEGLFASDSELLAWAPFTGEVEWSRAGMPDEAELEAQLAAFRGAGLPLSRVLLDVHSGRFFGAAGTVVMDLAAVSMLLLVATGIVNWMAFRKPRR